MSNQTKGDYSTLACEARKKILTMISRAGTSHAASNLSVIDIATVLYENLKEEDRVVWSKGWAAASIYYFLAKQGKIPYEDLEKFGKEVDGKIPYLGLAETTVPGVLVNGGSVGHGLPVAVGMAYAKKLKGEEGTIYCIMSDGELNEGTVWESVMLAAHLKLDNLVAIIDKNGWQAMGKTDEVIQINAQKTFQGMGWSPLQVDGHDYGDLEWAITSEASIKGFPAVIIAKTIKGKGVSFMENHLLYHYKHIAEEELEKALKELE